MRRFNAIAMSILFVLTFITGIAESGPSHPGPAVAHIFLVVLFTLSVITHVVLNRKALARYFGKTEHSRQSNGN